MFCAICLFIFKESGTFFPKDFFEPIRNLSFSLNDRARPKRELCPAYVIISYLQEMIPADTSPLLVCAKPSLHLARSRDFAWVSSFLTGQSISSFSGATTLPRAIPRRTVCAFGLESSHQIESSRHIEDRGNADGPPVRSQIRRLNAETISLQAQLQPPYLLGAFHRRRNNR